MAERIGGAEVPEEAAREEAAFWRPMRDADLPAVTALAARVHPTFPERPEVFAERRALAPDLCLVLDDAGRVAGYLVAHPWRSSGPPALDTLIGRLPEAPDAVQIHDLVIAPELRGRGLAEPAIAHVERTARGCVARLCLVAVSGKERFWSRRGFRPQPIGPGGSAGALASYGPDAVAMVKTMAG
ncbi:GNAT family N-acetyltransferase [Salinarimonas rosea]|uniref:GNAT family N-acetyltransferase n=1 Tax=Salinarimonas rosea TaxID=552063 RepID=UPI00069371A6|nr:GNAT family N-acetyltransferase [Salinarimonas rosea]